jgi:amino acid permease
MNKMKLKEWFEREYTLKYYEIKGIVIITLLSTLLLINVWPRFRNDALEFTWYWYVILIVILLITWKMWRKHSSKK